MLAMMVTAEMEEHAEVSNRNRGRISRGILRLWWALGLIFRGAPCFFADFTSTLETELFLEDLGLFWSYSFPLHPALIITKLPMGLIHCLQVMTRFPICLDSMLHFVLITCK